jgi:hypothetical protein
MGVFKVKKLEAPLPQPKNREAIINHATAIREFENDHFGSSYGHAAKWSMSSRTSYMS